MRLAVLCLTLVACGPDKLDPACQGQDIRSLELGEGVGGAFEPLETGEQVGLAAAPQGGLGITVLVQTKGLDLADGVSFDMSPEIDGNPEGSFTIARRVPCQGPQGGLLTGVVVGFDPIKYGSNDDLLSLNGKSVDLVVTATDAEGLSATVRKTVTLVVGG